MSVVKIKRHGCVCDIAKKDDDVAGCQRSVPQVIIQYDLILGLIKVCDQIGPVCEVECVVATAALKGVIASVAVQNVVTIAAIDFVVIHAACDAVVPCVPSQTIITVAPINHVVVFSS